MHGYYDSTDGVHYLLVPGLKFLHMLFNMLGDYLAHYQGFIKEGEVPENHPPTLVKVSDARQEANGIQEKGDKNLRVAVLQLPENQQAGEWRYKPQVQLVDEGQVVGAKAHRVRTTKLPDPENYQDLIDPEGESYSCFKENLWPDNEVFHALINITRKRAQKQTDT